MTSLREETSAHIDEMKKGIWVDKSGNRFKVIDQATCQAKNSELDGQYMIIYRATKNEKIVYVKPRNEFLNGDLVQIGGFKFISIADDKDSFPDYACQFLDLEEAGKELDAFLKKTSGKSGTISINTAFALPYTINWWDGGTSEQIGILVEE